MDLHQAERIADQALAFLGTCATNPDVPLQPSAAVDIGWHAFILDTRAYANFCEAVAGRFIHHVPHGAKCSTDDCSGTGKDGNENRETIIDQSESAVGYIAAAGYALDEELWSE